MTFTSDNTTINVTWSGFSDPESGIAKYEVSLWRNVSCDADATSEMVHDWYTLSGNDSLYQYIEQNLMVGI